MNQATNISTINESEIFPYLILKNPEAAHQIIDLTENVKNKFLHPQESGKILHLLNFLSSIYAGKDKYFNGNLEDFQKNMEKLEKTGVKIISADELKLFFRETQFAPEFLNYIQNPDFLTFYNNFSEKFFETSKTIHSLIFSFEIFKNASKNPEILARMKSGDFSDISEIMKFFKEKFSLNSHHPYFLASASHFMGNLENTKNLLSELESRGEKINSNQIFMVKIVSEIFAKNPEKREIFMNIDKMRELIQKEIYSRPEYARPKVEAIE